MLLQKLDILIKVYYFSPSTCSFVTLSDVKNFLGIQDIITIETFLPKPQVNSKKIFIIIFHVKCRGKILQSHWVCL